MKIDQHRFDECLDRIFQFLFEHHHINLTIQTCEINHYTPDQKTIEDKVIQLLRNVYKAQSQPKLDKFRQFFEWLEKDKHNLDSYGNFRAFLIKNHPNIQHQTIFEALRAWPGWGEKTSALFLKNLYLIQGSRELRSKYWADINLDNERMYLPVDAVIREIFRVLTGENMNFNKINKLLLDKGYADNEIIIWDDLWFWGFITQNSKIKDEPRHIGWNISKYWAIEESPKDVGSIKRIEQLAEEFINLLRPCYAEA